MRKIKNKKVIEKIKKIFSTLIITLYFAMNKAYAVSNTESIDGFILFACDWLKKIRRCDWIGSGELCSHLVGREMMQREKVEG